MPPVPPPRLSLQETWNYLTAQGGEPPVDASGQPFVPDHLPNHNDTVLGFSFFRTLLEDAKLENLTIPRTFFGHSGFERVSFRNSDVSESRMCWNDWVECDFTDAVLTGADLRGSEYVRCRFARADLTNADLRHSSFQDCDFTDARLHGARLTRWQGTSLTLTAAQQAEIEWHMDDGPEPPGG
jgi:BTB/POZ domain-containing protein KCTD9